MIKFKGFFARPDTLDRDAVFTIEDLRMEMACKEASELIPKILAEEWIKENKEQMFAQIDTEEIRKYVQAKITTVLMEKLSQ